MEEEGAPFSSLKKSFLKAEPISSPHFGTGVFFGQGDVNSAVETQKGNTTFITLLIRLSLITYRRAAGLINVLVKQLKNTDRTTENNLELRRMTKATNLDE